MAWFMASSKPFSETALNSVTRATLICLCASLTPSLRLLIFYITRRGGCQTSKGRGLIAISPSLEFMVAEGQDPVEPHLGQGEASRIGPGAGRPSGPGKGMT